MFKTVIGAAIALTLGAGAALAQTFPDKAINLMVAYPPGGSTDIGARIVASIAEKAIGQPIVVVNKGGAAVIYKEGDLAESFNPANEDNPVLRP